MVNISQFLLGSISTLAAEFVIVIILAVWFAAKDKKGGDSDAEKNSPVPTTTYDSGGKWYDGTC